MIGEMPKKIPHRPAKTGYQILTATATPARSIVPARPLKIELKTAVPTWAICVRSRGKNRTKKWRN